MKRVFTDISTIAHLWANQLQDEARNSGNFYFDGKTIFSYGRHFPIAKHVTNDAGEKAVLFTNRTYSNSTAKHVYVVSHACNHLNVIRCLSPYSSHKENFDSWQDWVEEIAGRLVNARKPEIYLSKIDGIKEQAEKYAIFFNIPIPAVLQEAFGITGRDRYNDYFLNKVAILKAQQKKEQIKLKKKHKIALDKWLNLETDRLYIRDGHDYLRVNNGRVETTQGVKVPMELAKRLYNKIDTNTLLVGESVLGYQVESVGKEIKIGCHNFKKPYLLSFGKQL